MTPSVSTPSSSPPAPATASSAAGTPSLSKAAEPLVKINNVDFAYSARQTLFGVELGIAHREVTAFIGPSGCGKSTLLRCINRINDMIEGARITKGNITLGGVDINHPDLDVIGLRRKVGMVFQKYNPFPRSIFENCAYGLEVAGVTNKKIIAETVERSLRATTLWDEVKDRLHESALGLSGGQQQRLCIARTLSVKPEVVLMDEPCAALDPIATAKIEQLIHELKKDYTIVIVTHNMEQAVRVSDRTAFFYLGKLIEFNETMKLFSTPEKEETERYLSGRMG
ncbi:MAG: phosphate ABC transporter ATP-binding protein PstB [Verrucomicrobium sp.]